MRLAQLTGSTVALLLSATTTFAQEAATSANQNVILDVDGTPIQVPVALATEACDLDEASVQQAAFSRIQTSGLDEETVQELMAATAPLDGINAGLTDAAAADPTSTPAPGSEPASSVTADAAAANTPAPGGEPASTNMAASGNTASGPLTGVLENAETTAADSTPDGSTTSAPGLDSEANSQILALAVCQVDIVRASDLGITGAGQGATASIDADNPDD